MRSLLAIIVLSIITSEGLASTYFCEGKDEKGKNFTAYYNSSKLDLTVRYHDGSKKTVHTMISEPNGEGGFRAGGREGKGGRLQFTATPGTCSIGDKKYPLKLEGRRMGDPDWKDRDAGEHLDGCCKLTDKDGFPPEKKDPRDNADGRKVDESSNKVFVPPVYPGRTSDSDRKVDESSHRVFIPPKEPGRDSDRPSLENDGKSVQYPDDPARNSNRGGQ